MSNTIDTTNTIIFNNEGKPEVYTNVENKLLCTEMAENLLLNCVQIDWQDVHLSNIGRIPELSNYVAEPNDFNINTTEELLWVIDQLVAKAYGSLPSIVIRFTNGDTFVYNGATQQPTISATVGNDEIDNTNNRYYTITRPQSSVNAGQYTITISLTEEGARKYVLPQKTYNYTISKRPITLTVRNNITVDPGTNVSIPGNVSVTSGQLVSGHSITAVTITPSKPSTSGPLNFTSATIKKSSTNVTTNYDITYEGGSVIVNQQEKTATPTITYTIDETNHIYTFTANGNGTITLTDGTHNATGTGSASIEITQTNVAQNLTFTAYAQETNKAKSDAATLNYTIPALAQTYYWYFGQTDPSTMSSIDTSGTDYNAGGGWTSTGTSVPEQINQLVKGGDASKNWYAAVPITTGTTLQPTWSDMATIDTGVQPTTTKTYTNGNGVTYQIYIYNNSARKTIIFAKL